MNKDLVGRSSPFLQRLRILPVRNRQHGSVGQGDLEAAGGLNEKQVYHEAGVDAQEGVAVFLFEF